MINWILLLFAVEMCFSKHYLIETKSYGEKSINQAKHKIFNKKGPPFEEYGHDYGSDDTGSGWGAKADSTTTTPTTTTTTGWLAKSDSTTTTTTTTTTTPTTTSCTWDDWGSWSEVDECTESEMSRQRKCRNSSNGQFCQNSECVGESTESLKSSPDKKCCEWETWGLWSSVTNTCSDGTITRERRCAGRSVDCTPQDCDGGSSQAQEVQEVKGGKCCEWAVWSAWSAPSDECQDAEVERKRSCVATIDSTGSCLPNDCEGGDPDSEEKKTLPGKTCCAWTAWTTSACSVSCGAGKILRTRECECSSGPTQCDGLPREETDCNLMPCPMAGAQVQEDTTTKATSGWHGR